MPSLISRIGLMTDTAPFAALALAAALLTITPDPIEAQVRSTQDAATAYGARLAAPDATATVNQNRVNSRINNRLSLRIERYRPDSVANPTAVFRSTQDDGTRTPIIAAEDASDENSEP